jgi:hypothetical protein
LARFVQTVPLLQPLFVLCESQFLRECPNPFIKYLAKVSCKYLYLLSKSGVDWIAFKKINEMVQEVEIVGANHDLGPLCGYSVLDCKRHLHPPKALCMVIGLLNTELNYGLLETENHACSFHGAAFRLEDRQYARSETQAGHGGIACRAVDFS